MLACMMALWPTRLYDGLPLDPLPDGDVGREVDDGDEVPLPHLPQDLHHRLDRLLHLPVPHAAGR